MKVPANAFEITCYYTWRGEDGIVRTKVKPGSEVGVKEARENSAAVNSLSVNGDKFPLLIDARGIKSMTREARNQFSVRGRETSTTSFAIIIDSPLSRVIGNFFMGINKPAVPTRLFENEEEAIKWLLSLKVNKK
ncbi:MAG: STAS/SEC14 domain-containing protein [Bacteroidota bacterium]